MSRMLFVYKPEGVEPRKWEFKPERLMNAELEVIERRTGLSFNEWQVGVERASVLAIHGLLFVLLKRDSPTLTWEQVQFAMADIDFETTPEEDAGIVEALERRLAEGGTLTDGEVNLLAQLRANLPSAADEGPDAVPGEQVSPGNPPAAAVADSTPPPPTLVSAPAGTPSVSTSSDVGGSGPSPSTSTPHQTLSSV